MSGPWAAAAVDLIAAAGGELSLEKVRAREVEIGTHARVGPHARLSHSLIRAHPRIS